MTRYKVEFSPEARQQAQQVMQWWRANRLKAPERFGDELEAAIQQLASMPLVGVGYARSKVSGMRRLLMPRTRYHLYYTVATDQEKVWIHAVWHASRRRVPGL